MGTEELDELIAESLRSYSAAVPRPGLERRVLNRIYAAPAPRPRLLRWVAAGALVAACVASIFIAPAKRPVKQTTQQPITQAAVEPPVPEPQISPRRKIRPSRRELVAAPAPLSNEEKAFLGLVENAPLQARQLLSSTELRPIEPITIEQLSIPPVEETGE